MHFASSGFLKEIMCAKKDSLCIASFWKIKFRRALDQVLSGSSERLKESMKSLRLNS